MSTRLDTRLEPVHDEDGRPFIIAGFGQRRQPVLPSSSAMPGISIRTLPITRLKSGFL